MTVEQMTKKTSTSTRVDRAQSGAIPYRGRYLGMMLSRPARADAPANHKMPIVEMSYAVPSPSPSSEWAT